MCCCCYYYYCLVSGEDEEDGDVLDAQVEAEPGTVLKLIKLVIITRT